MNCPSRVSGKSESDPIYIGMAQDSSALALRGGFLLSCLFCCEEFMLMGKTKQNKTQLKQS